MNKTTCMILGCALLTLSSLSLAQTVSTTVTTNDVAACQFPDASSITGYIVTSDGGNRFPSTGTDAPLNSSVNLTLSTEYDHGIKAVYFDGSDQDDMAFAQNCDGLTSSASKVALTFKADPIHEGFCYVTCQYQ